MKYICLLLQDMPKREENVTVRRENQTLLTLAKSCWNAPMRSTQ